MFPNTYIQVPINLAIIRNTATYTLKFLNEMR